MHDTHEIEDLGDQLVSKRDRERILKDLDDPFAYLSGHIPDLVDLKKKKHLHLKKFILYQKKKKSLKERDLISIAWVIKQLDVLIKKEMAKVQKKDVSKEEAESKALEIKGLLRAHILLAEMLEGEDLDPIEVDKEEELEDLKRWMVYARKLG